MAVQCPQTYTISSGETEVVAVDFQSHLDSGETLTGTPTITEVGTSDLTLSNKVVNTAALTILGRTAAIGQAVQCKVVGQVSGRSYRIRISVATTSTPARTLIRDILFSVA